MEVGQWERFARRGESVRRDGQMVCVFAGDHGGLSAKLAIPH